MKNTTIVCVCVWVRMGVCGCVYEHCYSQLTIIIDNLQKSQGTDAYKALRFQTLSLTNNTHNHSNHSNKELHVHM